MPRIRSGVLLSNCTFNELLHFVVQGLTDPIPDQDPFFDELVRRFLSDETIPFPLFHYSALFLLKLNAIGVSYTL